MIASKNHRQFMVTRASWVIAVIIVAFVGLIVRLVWIQGLQHDKYRQLAFRQHWSKKTIQSRRGEIRDRNGVLLAISQQGYSCYADPQMVKNKKATARQLASHLQMSPQKLYKRISHPKRRFVWLKRLLSPSQKQKIKALKLSGIHFRTEPRRIYPHRDLAAHILGFVGVDHQGLEGVEASFNRELAGEDGFTWILKDGRLARLGIYSPEAPTQRPVHGANIYLTIDIMVQYTLQQQLAKIVEKFQPAGACGVVISSQNGEVLAMASYPTFDPNRFSDSPPRNWRNLAIADAHELGSVMKPLVVGAALADNIITPDTVFFCHNGAYRIPGRVLHDSHGYGDLTVEGILIKSSNIGAALIGQRLGSKRLFHYLRHLGFGKKTGIALPGEACGILKPAARWDNFTITSIPMGHEICVTPLQMTSAYSTIIGDGVYLPPCIISKIIHANGVVAYRYHSEHLKRIFPRHVVHDLRRILRQVVEDGTAKRANAKIVPVAGKTGTAQKLIQGRYSHSKYMAVFIGFAPAGRPHFCCLIAVDEPKGAHYGGTVSAPGVASVLQQITLRRKLSQRRGYNPPQ